jgi:RNA polymerase sigma-70 factor (ECF subfamily)
VHSTDRGPRRLERRSSWDYVRAAQDGDPEAFADLYRRYRRDIYSYLLVRTRSVPLAEDLTSETFLRALRKIGSVRQQTDDVRSWIITIARNLTLDHHKSHRTRREVLFEAPIGRQDVVDSAEQTVLRRQLAVDLAAAQAQLSTAQRMCLFLRFYCGFSVARTADAMGSSSGAVRALQYRALRELAAIWSARAQVADHGETPVRGAA